MTHRLPGPSTAVLGAAFLLAAAAAGAQETKPGPMQSGQHVQKAAAPSGGEATVPGEPPSGAPAQFDVPKLFATSCGWCHLDGGRVAGKGPQLMGTQKTDAEIVSRIRNGKIGAMPAFGSTFNEDQLRAIIAYIRGLKS